MSRVEPLAAPIGSVAPARAPRAAESPAHPLVQLRSVTVRFGAVVALSGVDLTLARGERLALIGANGSGKSTLLRVMHGLAPPSEGAVCSDRAARQAMVFQRPHMLSAGAAVNVALGLWMAGRPWREARRDALAALQRVGLAGAAQRNARTLSGGQQQRLALARAWSLAPDLLLLDEPTASLDPRAKREVEALIGEFAAAGMTLAFASHNLGQVKRLATRVAYLEQGRLLADLPVHDFFNGPLLARVSPEAALFLKGELG
jgi:tungstate transport system ATP-binding protein